VPRADLGLGLELTLQVDCLYHLLQQSLAKFAVNRCSFHSTYPEVN
jgi:hypothetical protein